MQRRQFGKKIAAAILAGSLLNPGNAFAFSTRKNYKKALKPKKLKKGDTIGMITPGSYISDEALEKAVTNVESLGFKVKLSKNIRAKRGFNAGTDLERLLDLHTMFTDNDVAGIWCARGGYGCTRLLPYVDYSLIKKHPKALIGYSDVTALLNAIYLKTDLVGFHGPVGASEFSDYTKEHLLAVLVEGKEKHVIPISQEHKNNENPAYQARQLRYGKVTGRLVGGNLSLLSSMSGTEWEPDYKDTITFMEDIGEKPYRLDRMLTQLRQTGNFKEAAAIAFGIFEDCAAPEGEDSLSLSDTILDRTTDLQIPAFYGLSFGHITDQFTLPVGIMAELDTRMQTLTLLESAVEE
jgi:muramoyltetrapeptide carboxypeptidase